MSNALGKELFESSATVSEDLGWPMPMGEEYAAQLKSNFADFANIGGPRSGGCGYRGLLPRQVYRRPELGAPRYRRHGLEVRRAQGRNGPPGADAVRVPARQSRHASLTQGADGTTSISTYCRTAADESCPVRNEIRLPAGRKSSMAAREYAVHILTDATPPRQREPRRTALDLPRRQLRPAR